MNYDADDLAHIRAFHNPDLEGDGASRVPWIVMFVALLLFSLGLWARSHDSAHPIDWFDVGVKGSELLVWIAGLWSVILLKRQIVDQRTTMQREFQWKRLISYHEFFEQVPGEELNRKFWDLAEGCGFEGCLVGFGKEMSADSLAKIHETKGGYCMRAYLDEFEKFCGAIQSGLVDSRYAYSLQCMRVIRTYTVCKPFIDDVQRHNKMAYLELEKAARNWSQKRAKVDAAYRDQLGVPSGFSSGLDYRY